MSRLSDIKFVRQNSYGFRVNREGRSTYVYGRFCKDGSVVVSVFINREMVFSETIAPTRRETNRSTRDTADFLGGQA